MCTPGADGLRAFVYKTCGVGPNADGAIIRRYREHGVRVSIGEWSLGTCGMFGTHPLTLTNPDVLFALYASARSTFVDSGADGDFFWTGLVPTAGYDPTLYTNDDGLGTRAAVEGELARVAARSASWREQNKFVASPTAPVDADYLRNWHFLRLANVTTTAGHPIALPLLLQSADPLSGARAGLRISGSCDYLPAPTPPLKALTAKAWACDAAQTCPAGRWVELSLLGGGVLLIGVLLLLLLPLGLRALSRSLHSGRSITRPRASPPALPPVPKPPPSAPPSTSADEATPQEAWWPWLRFGSDHPLAALRAPLLSRAPPDSSKTGGARGGLW